MKSLIVAVLVLIAAPALAHEAKPLHGGRAAIAGNYHVEMVAKGDAIEVYLLDHNNKPMSLAGYKGVAILAADGKSERIVLEFGTGEFLAGKASTALPVNPKGVVQIIQPDGKTVQAKFN
jgi:competence protein ComGC